MRLNIKKNRIFWNIGHILPALVLISSLSVINSCVSIKVGETASVTPIKNNVKMENLGKARGKGNWAWSILGLWMVNRPDIDSAIDDAVARKKGDTLINVTYYKNFTYFILFSMTRVVVEGNVVRFTEVEKRNKRGKR